MGVSEGMDAEKVRVDGEEAVLHLTDQSVMFEKGGKISGFERSTIRMVKPDRDAMVVAYSAGGEVKSVRIEPMTAVVGLLLPEPQHDTGSSTLLKPIAYQGLEDIFERMYWQTRKELEEKLEKVQAEPENKSLRLTPEEEAKYSQVSRQMENLLSRRYGFNVRAEDSPLSFWGLERQSREVQLNVIKTLHVSFLRLMVGPKVEISDIAFSSTEVWPEDWERILIRIGLAKRPFLSENFKLYLSARWTSRPGEKKPVLARP